MGGKGTNVFYVSSNMSLRLSLDSVADSMQNRGS